jgi:hypothetical protein
MSCTARVAEGGGGAGSLIGAMTTVSPAPIPSSSASSNDESRRAGRHRLGTGDLDIRCSPLALEFEVLADGVVKDTHPREG